MPAHANENQLELQENREYWPLQLGKYQGRKHSRLDQISRDNVHQALSAKEYRWAGRFQPLAPDRRRFGQAPIEPETRAPLCTAVVACRLAAVAAQRAAIPAVVAGARPLHSATGPARPRGALLFDGFAHPSLIDTYDHGGRAAWRLLAARRGDGTARAPGNYVTEEAGDIPVEVRRFSSRGDAEQYALVLAAVGIDCQLVARAGEIGLCVAGSDAARARAELASYARENQRGRESSPPRRRLIDGREGMLIYWALLLFLNGAARRQMFSHDWVAAGAAQAGLIVDGAWWRTVTALGLHADMGHLVSNLAFGGLLGLLLVQPLGPGLAWLAILLTGALGNGLNALLQPATHAAIGASTAVFGALGLLAALTWRHQAPLGRPGLRRWLPFGGGLMLLAYLGFGGERTDIGGHVAGFVIGCALGLALAWAATRVPQGLAAQRAYGASALGLVALAWLLALRA